jgi:hypothetical protein
MFWAGLIFVCILMLVLFFGVTIAGGRAHDRQNLERTQEAARPRSGGESANNDNDGCEVTSVTPPPPANDRGSTPCTLVDPDGYRPI